MTVPRPRAALVGSVPARLADAELTFRDRAPIDVDRARDQHAAYRNLLAGLGLEIVALPPADALPDSVFVEDVVVVVDRTAVLTRPGARSRRDEVALARAPLMGRGYDVRQLAGPGTLDGGDVLQVGDTVYVGRSTRTNAAGLEELAALLAPLGRRVVPVAVDGALHLKTAATALPDGTIVADVARVEVAAFAEREVVAAPEPEGANLLTVGEAVVVSASAPRTARLVADRGVSVHTVALDELEKAEAGPTCLSVLLPA